MDPVKPKSLLKGWKFKQKLKLEKFSTCRMWIYYGLCGQFQLNCHSVNPQCTLIDWTSAGVGLILV